MYIPNNITNHILVFDLIASSTSISAYFRANGFVMADGLYLPSCVPHVCDT